jgi:hypothetical protein
MTINTEYRDLLIKQYWEKPKARAEIEAMGYGYEKIYNFFNSFSDKFDLEQATGDQLNILGKILGVSRYTKNLIPKKYFGFAENPNSTGFGDKFQIVYNVFPFKDKFENDYTDYELNDVLYRQIIKAKAALLITSNQMVSDGKISINDTINTLFNGLAYAIDKKNMSLTLYVSPKIDETLLRYIISNQLLPKPAGVRYSIVVQYEPGLTFGFSDNINSLGFADKFDLENQPGGVFAQKFII